MKRLFKVELSRSLTSKSMFTALIIGLIIVIAQVFQDVIPMARLIDEGLKYNKPMVFPGSAFMHWLSQSNSMETSLYYMILPILATIPFADSFFTDRKSGYIKNVLIRAKKKDYYISKYMATFISGGLAVVIPLIVSFLITSMILPSMLPEVTNGGVFPTSIWSKLFYTNPYFYVLGYLIIDFLFSGFIATIALSVSLIADYRFAVLIAPFLIYIFIYSLGMSLGITDYQPYFFLQSCGVFNSSFSVIFIEMVGLGAITSSTFLIKGVKEDIY
ncbi:MAG: hypothetical protein RR844_01230 [Clostridium sp.]